MTMSNPYDDWANHDPARAELERRRGAMRLGQDATPDQVNAAYEAGVAANKAQGEGGEGGDGGFGFGQRMQGLAGAPPPMVQINHEGIDRARALSDQSYAQQQQAMGLMRAQAQGQGPSVAALQGQSGMDAAAQQMMGNRGGPMTGMMMSGAPQHVAAQAAGARGQEIGAAQGGWGQAAEATRGLSNQDRQQALQNAWASQNLGLNEQQQNMQRELALQKLSQSGYQMASGKENDIRNLYAGLNASMNDYNRAAQAGYLNMIGSGIGSAGGMLGGIGSLGGGGGGGPGRSQYEDYSDKYGNG